MSGYENQSESFENDEFYGDNSGGGLRKQLEKALGEIKELREQVNEKAHRETATDLLKDAGIDPAFATLMPADADPKAWVEEHKTLLGGKPAAQQDQANDANSGDTPPDPAHAAALEAEREALEQMGDAQEDGSPSVVTSDALERMSKINSEEELLKFFASGGAAG